MTPKKTTDSDGLFVELVALFNEYAEKREDEKDIRNPLHYLDFASFMEFLKNKEFCGAKPQKIYNY